jgi:hypothetical protein
VAGQLGHGRLAGRVDEEAAHQAQRLVAGGAVDRPGRRQFLVRAEDLLHHDPRVRRRLAQPSQVLARVGQAVRVVHADAGDLQVVGPAEDRRVHGLEHDRVLDADRGEGVDVEEPPVVEVRVGPPPVDQPVVLALVHLLGGAAAGARGDREPVVVVAQFTVLDGQTVERVGAEHGQQQFADGPVDVEEPGVFGFLAVRQHVPPPLVRLRVGDPHVVRHDVDDQAQLQLLELADQPHPAVLTAERRAHAARVDDVVAVRGTGCRGQDRRRVHRAHAERGQVVRDVRHVPEGHVRPELEPVGRAWGHTSSSARSSTTRDRAVTGMVDFAGIVGPPPTTPVAVSTTTVQFSA